MSATPADGEVEMLDNPLVAEARLTAKLTATLAELADLELALTKNSAPVPSEDSFLAGVRLSMAQIAVQLVHQQLDWLGLQIDGEQLEDDAFVLTPPGSDLMASVERLVGQLAGLRVARRVSPGTTP
jgi:hypothetical protein